MKSKIRPIDRIKNFFNRHYEEKKEQLSKKLEEKGGEMLEVVQDHFYLFLFFGLMFIFLVVLVLIFRSKKDKYYANYKRYEYDDAGNKTNRWRTDKGRIILHKNKPLPERNDGTWYSNPEDQQ